MNITEGRQFTQLLKDVEELKKRVLVLETPPQHLKVCITPETQAAIQKRRGRPPKVRDGN